MPADELVEPIVLGDLRRRFLQADCGTEVDDQLKGRFARFREWPRLDDGADADVDAEEIVEIIGALATLGAGRLIVTCADLIRRLGTLVSAATSGLPLAHVTRSPYVAAGLETLTPLSLARALIAIDRNADEGSAQ